MRKLPPKSGRALPRAIVGRGAAYGDFDNDGDLDLLITANNGPARLLRNDNGNQNDMLRVKTVGTRSNRDGIGAKVTVKTSKGTRLFGMVKTGSSYLSQSELPLTFGLGKPEAGKTVSLTIVWPSGQKDSVANVEPNQFITVQEGRGIVSATPDRFVKVSARNAAAQSTAATILRACSLKLPRCPCLSALFASRVQCYLCGIFMNILNRLFEQRFHSPVEQVKPLQGELGGSGRKIIRLSGGNQRDRHSLRRAGRKRRFPRIFPAFSPTRSAGTGNLRRRPGSRRLSGRGPGRDDAV